MRTHLILTAMLLGAAALAGCASEGINPVAADTTTTGSGGAGGGGGSGGSGGSHVVTPIRTVEQRNPFGNVAATDNLLWDGDFEWSSPFSDQYGWLFGPPYAYAFPAATIGAACRSGIKCVTLGKNRGIIGIGVGSQSQALEVTVFVKPKTGVCADTDVNLLDIGNFSKDVTIPPETEAPDSIGWCLYRATVPSYPQKVYLLVDNNTGDEVVVDDAVVRPVPPAMPPPPPPPGAVSPPTAERLARLDAARAAIAELRHPRNPPPNAARRAFQEYHAR